MDRLPELSAFGERIVVCGPSCSGKSTFAVALGKRLGVPAVHLDQFRFQPRSDWTERPNDEFETLHDTAATEDQWVIEGNYSRLMPLRLSRATGIIELVTGGVPARLWRYARRTLFEPDRPGALESRRDSIKWSMIQWIAKGEPARREARLVQLRASGLPMIEVNSLPELNAIYRAWGLTRS